MAEPLSESLPAWLYTDPAFFALERKRLFRQTWQIVCHVNDIPATGDYQAFDFLDDKILTVRGEDGEVRSFHNVCRHRASRLADGSHGNCGRRLVCPYHAWSYGLDGRLAAIPRWQGFEGQDTTALGLKPVEQEVWRGFVFIRLGPGLPSVAEMMSPYDAEISAYAFEKLQPRGKVVMRPRPVNWKNVSDNYADGLHIPVAHPGLSRLFAGTYALEAQPWVDKMSGVITKTPSSNWSERGYQGLLGGFDHLPAPLQRTWNYYKLWPNMAFDVYPDQVDFMQFIPVSATQTLIREIAYAHPDSRRETRAARYLNWRINRQVNAEDTVLIERVQAGMASSSYVSGPLSPAEPCLASFAARMRAAIPEAALPHPPVGQSA
ncbi:aromatic ring-hydroxylating dioxygenase subunit alpha [Caulobacter sp. S45]|uniref:aromatic ring-hydroxylating oxygenase subunit alpha n=1 Tax=Caulobacter sp. S45 TaxID=1641861 RepID=UPI00131C947A|nr:aromatic ring-hydroxylating dioxygenase subunit alpha [Caulobacter sp. S45]